MGVVDQTGKEVIPAKYLSVGVFNIFGYAKVRENISINRKVNCGQSNPCIEKENLPFYYFIDKNGVQRSNYFENINDWDDNEDYFIDEINKRDEIVRKKDMHVIYQSKGNTRLSIDANRYKSSDYFIKESRNNGKKDLVDIKGHHLTNFLYEDV
ncbi:WG repeat-containing protein [Chryseobacterium sp. JJR-5R]|uniref:WG repeat-containing protein n=1 Tax=Chryseobacterium sp. JJR-5R TaxID=3093923 RepID=UPI002A758B37|nr:WG repeat-containing protein [Chryseobacterium sp. JJR-5R]WPO82316.1 WG repeat-containing protein [Chryseobacterium sp. JJR-5R]